MGLAGEDAGARGNRGSCARNLTLESLWFGVPIVMWPLYAEQQLNAVMLVRVMGLAAEVKMEGIKKVMEDEELLMSLAISLSTVSLGISVDIKLSITRPEKA